MTELTVYWDNQVANVEVCKISDLVKIVLDKKFPPEEPTMKEKLRYYDVITLFTLNLNCTFDNIPFTTEERKAIITEFANQLDD